MHLPLDEHFLQWAEKAVGTACLVQMIGDSLDRVAKGESRTKFLNGLKIRGHWQRAIVNGVIKSHADLATVIRVAELPIVIDTRQPWHLVNRHDEIAVILGIRVVDIPEVSLKVRQRGVGARDTLAQANLANTCRRLGIDADLIPHLVPSVWPMADAQAFIDNLYKAPNLGAVIAIGSPAVNPLAEVLASQALDGKRSPARFRWSGFDPGPNTLLSVRSEKSCDEGIVVDQPRGFFPRTRDDDILAMLRDNSVDVFPDCGMLLIDARNRPLKILCSGHGGCGTVAAVDTLGDHVLINRLLAASANNEHSLLGRGRVLLVVTIDRSSGVPRNIGVSPIGDLVPSKRRIVWSSILIDELGI